MWKLLSAAFAIAGAIGGAPAPAAAQTPINVSYQPSLYWALPYYIATEKGWWKDARAHPGLLGLSRRGAAGRGRAGEVVGRGRDGLGPGRARGGALGPPYDRHHQRRVQGQRPDGSRREVRRLQSQPAKPERAAHPLDHEFDRRLLGPELPQEVRRRLLGRAVRQSRPGPDHLRHYLQQRRRRRSLGAEQLHPGGEGRGENALHRRRRRRDRSGRAGGSRRLREGEPEARRGLSRRVPAQLGLGQGQS